MNYQSSIYQSVDSQPEIAIKQIADRILSSGILSRKDHLLLISTVFNHGNISNEERRQINRIFDHIQTGQLELLDW